MPNTLVHLGIQGFTARTLVPAIDLRLVYLSCVLPDVPWIAQRALHFLAPGVDRIALSLWCGVQGSLLFSVILAASIAVLAIEPRKVFAVLASGALFHLLLDMMQVKWGRGVILFAPFDWQPISLGLVRPEHPLSYVLLAASVLFVVVTWRRIEHGPVFRRSSPARWCAAGTLALVYLLAPALLAPALREANIYDSATLADANARTGKRAWFDRARLRRDETGRPMLEIFTGEVLRVEGLAEDGTDLISTKGVFTGPDTYAIQSYHRHPNGVRLGASAIGVFLVAVLWARTLLAGGWRRER